MVDFTGATCPKCRNKFKDKDDIVVCPICGTPHHRECYLKTSECFNKKKHSENFVWINPNKPKESEIPAEIICLVCTHRNPFNAVYCERCKAFLFKNQNGSGSGAPAKKESLRKVLSSGSPNSFFKISFGKEESFIGIDLKEDIKGVNTQELARYIQNNVSYYMSVFKLLEKKNKNKFNLSAFLFSGAWFLYRKQYKVGISFFIVNFIITVAVHFVNFFYAYDIYEKIVKSFNIPLDSVELFAKIPEFHKKLFSLPTSSIVLFFLPNILIALNFILMIFCGFIANKCYMKNCFSQIEKIKKDSKSDDDLNQKFLIYGGVNYHVIWGIILFFLIFRLIPFL
ncbi:MAG: DUF2628 domain-containing protein [Oscillospiraceae bacterium]|nr:DUF2628 domain-containing protein [Oscillospiraceae bacterium]